MRIGIYAELARDAKPTGIGLHVRNLLTALAKLDRTNSYLLYYPRPLRGAETACGWTLPGSNFEWRPVRMPEGWRSRHPRLWWDWYLPAVLAWDRPDVFHGPNHYLPRFNRRRSVVTIHDLAYFRMKLYDDAYNEAIKTWTLRALDRAAVVIALSENTRRDLEGLGVPPGLIRVIYGGGNIVPDDQIRRDRTDELRHRWGLPARYVLSVGTLLPRKNYPFLIRAFARSKREQSLPHKLVLAGHRGEAAPEIDQLVAELGLTGDVIVTGYVEDWQLPLLYELAEAFVLPSRYEGFTLVTLEAMAYGTPVIATDSSSIREGVGDAARLVPVDDDTTLARTLTEVLDDAELRQRMIAAGREQAEKFTWEANACQTLEVYRGLGTRSRCPAVS